MKRDKRYRRAKVYPVPQGSVYDFLDKSEFKQRMGQSFPAVYLTVISIIQGVALGLLAQKTLDYVSNSKTTDAQAWALAPYATLSFCTIVIVSFEYNWFVGVYRWSPKFLDTSIPFLLGIAEISPLFFLTSPVWWWRLNAFLVGVGIFGYVNTLTNCKPDMFPKRLYTITRRGIFISIAMLSLLAPILLGVSLIYEPYISNSTKIMYWPIYEIIAFVAYISMMTLLMFREHKFLCDLHEFFELRY